MGNGVNLSPAGKWVAYSDYQQLEKLLEGFAELYAESPLAPHDHERAYHVWREYLEQTGKHMIRTEEGWEEGQAKAVYEEIARTEGIPIGAIILDEVNAPAEV
jgi:hypothetical protein